MDSRMVEFNSSTVYSEIAFITKSLIRYWYVIVLVVGLSTSVMALFNFKYRPPVYETSATYTLPIIDATDNIKVVPQSYFVFAMSDKVLRKTLAGMRWTRTMTVDDLRKGDLIKIQIDDKANLMTVTTKTDSPESSYKLANVWYDSFTTEIQQYISEQVKMKIKISERKVESIQKTIDQMSKTLVAPTENRDESIAVQLAISSAYGQQMVEAVTIRDHYSMMLADIKDLMKTETLIEPSKPISPNISGKLLNVIATAFIACVISLLLVISFQYRRVMAQSI